ncbi:MAG: hypothetical protein AB7F86_10825 [Bdellovibrionales bacterium]
MSFFGFVTLSILAWSAPHQMNDFTHSLKGFGLKGAFDTCEVQELRQNEKPEHRAMEAQLHCSDLMVELELSAPTAPEVAGRLKVNQEIRLTESYAAGRNPYTGFISSTSQCPPSENLIKVPVAALKTQQTAFVGRLNERGLWGACGKSPTDHWGASLLLNSGSAFLELRVKSTKPMARKNFIAKVEKFFKQLERVTP